MATAKKDQTISEQASVATDVGNQKRSIQMKMFVGKTDKSEVALAFEKGDEAGSKRALGQIVGQIFDVKERTFENKDGSTSVMLQAFGEFEAVVYATGEVISSGVADLPKYYLESVKAALDKSERVGGPGAILCALEIVLVGTGKSIPVAYEVKNLVQRPAESPLNRLKAQMAAAGRLRLPPPPAETQAALPAPTGDYVDAETGEITAAEDDAEPAESA